MLDPKTVPPSPPSNSSLPLIGLAAAAFLAAVVLLSKLDTGTPDIEFHAPAPPTIGQWIDRTQEIQIGEMRQYVWCQCVGNDAMTVLHEIRALFAPPEAFCIDQDSQLVEVDIYFVHVPTTDTPPPQHAPPTFQYHPPSMTRYGVMNPGPPWQQVPEDPLFQLLAR